ncbi:hypothetical protein SCB71_14455 [Herbiconiux sp. KACC 21604]|uniref:hypothetical protein n=1 Tax=unclassified Herbiconiux TaxID=2618217 RepID=UPI0014916978|nr:hypothetical protein [Herbiconiux sp. SALV-R1]QJU54344.1 hypothetical protein HL652_12395 [Herbiconiux sp. SALV-R1]WPO85414.1 hypothetical protein SCB71_14455 [Herbiconiux sp. KACC 21604]
MVALPDAAASHYQQEQRIGAVTASGLARLWSQLDDSVGLDTGYARIEPRVLELIVAGQAAAARTGVAYVSEVLYETDQVDLPVMTMRPEAFAGTAADGRDLGGLFYSSVTKTKEAVAAGASIDVALLQGRNELVKLALTTVADSNREAVSGAMGIRPAVEGWVRMLNPPSCGRCAILAGKFFRWNQGFQRHPRCDCRHIPASESIAGDLTTDPYEYFRSLAPAEQDKLFGRIEARAINDGADIYRVMNTKTRGLATGGRQAAKYGTPSRLTVDEIYRQAGHRTNAIRMMTEEGYITGPQNAAGNILGRVNGFGQLGKGGRARAASDSVIEATMTGVRNPLDRYTMTAAERRMYDAWYRANAAKSGYWPRSIGANSADKNTRMMPITDQQRGLVARELQRQLDDLPNQPQQVRDLARTLGLI